MGIISFEIMRACVVPKSNAVLMSSSNFDLTEKFWAGRLAFRYAG